MNDKFVPLETVLTCEGTVAEVTLVVLFPCVGNHMVLETTDLSEALFTFFTFVWANASVCTRVDLQLLLLVKFFTAHGALETFNTTGFTEVLQHPPKVPEDFPTVRAQICTGLGLCLAVFGVHCLEVIA